MPSNFFSSQYDELLRIAAPQGTPITALLDGLYAAPTASLVTGSDVSEASAMRATVGSEVMVSREGRPSALYSLAGMLASSPLFAFSPNPLYGGGDALASVPAYARLAGDAAPDSLEDLPLAAWHFRLHQAVTHTERRCLLQHLRLCGHLVTDFESINTGTTAIQKGTSSVQAIVC